MGKVLGTVLESAAIVGIGALTGGSGFAFFGLTGLAAFGAETAALTALSLVSQALTPTPSASFPTFGAPARSATPTRKYIYGRAKVAGDLIFAQGYGSDNEYMSMVWAVSDGPIEAFDGFFLENESISLSGTDATGSYAGYLSFYPHLGATDQTADSVLTGALPGEWTTNHRLQGIAYYHVRYKFSQDVFPGGIKQSYALVRGRKVYDPREDSTQTGGSGTQRTGDPSTWTYSNNPALVWLDYVKDSWIGPGYSLDEIDIGSVMAAANICDELVTNADTSTMARYTFDGPIDSANQINDNVNYILSAMAGTRVWKGGRWHIFAGAWATPEITFTQDDLAGDLQITTKITRKSRYNAIRGLFLDPDQNYVPSDFPPKTNSTYETQDGERIWKDFSYPYTWDHRAAQRLAQIALKTSRSQAIIRFPCNQRGMLVGANDTVYVTLARYGWTNKTFRVLEWQNDTASEIITLTLKEDVSANWDFNPATDELTKSTPGVPSTFDPSTVFTPDSLAAAATSIDGTGGVTIPALSVTWTAVSSPFIASMDLEFKLAADTHWTAAKGVDPGAGAQIIPGLVPSTDYDIRARFTSTVGVKCAWQTVTATTGASYIVSSASSVDWAGVTGTGKPDDNADVTSANTALDTSYVDGVPSFAAISGATDYIWDDFTYASAADFQNVWVLAAGKTNIPEIAPVAVAGATGGAVIRIGNNSGNDEYWAVRDHLLAYDPNSLYEIGIVARKVSGSSNVMYCGIQGVAADKTTLVNAAGANDSGSQHYICLNGSALSGSLAVYKGYFKGLATSNTTGAHSDPTSPAQLYNGVAYIQPLIIANNASQPGQMDVDLFWLRKVGNYSLDAGGIGGTSAAAVLASIAGAQATADGKIVTFYTTSTPTATGVGDLWYNSSTKRVKRWDGSSWVDVASLNSGALADLNTVDTAQINTNAVTGVAPYANTAAISLNPGNVSIASATLTTHGGKVLIWASYMHGGGVSSATHNVQLKRGSTVLYDTTGNPVQSWPGLGTWNGIVYVDDPGSGTFTYTVVGSTVSGSCSAINRGLVPMEIKR